MKQRAINSASFARMFQGVVVGREFDSFDGLTSYDIPSGMLVKKDGDAPSEVPKKTESPSEKK
jgi:hypothetical protein